MKPLSLFLLFLMMASASAAAGTQKVIFAGGCFWCMEPPYDKLEGVVATTSGYAGGTKKNPTYREVATGQTNHIEVVEIEYDPAVVSFTKLLEVFWVNVDPLDGGGQFCDRGAHYRTAIFYSNEREKALAEASIREVEALLGAEVKTELLRNTGFWRAEEYHQDYYQKNPVRYRFYRWNCGRDQRLEQLWGGVELKLKIAED